MDEFEDFYNLKYIPTHDDLYSLGLDFDNRYKLAPTNYPTEAVYLYRNRKYSTTSTSSTFVVYDMVKNFDNYLDYLNVPWFDNSTFTLKAGTYFFLMGCEEGSYYNNPPSGYQTVFNNISLGSFEVIAGQQNRAEYITSSGINNNSVLFSGVYKCDREVKLRTSVNRYHSGSLINLFICKYDTRDYYEKDFDLLTYVPLSERDELERVCAEAGYQTFSTINAGQHLADQLENPTIFPKTVLGDASLFRLDQGIPDNYRYGQYLELRHNDVTKSSSSNYPERDVSTWMSLTGDGDNRRTIGNFSRSLDNRNGNHYVTSFAARVAGLVGDYTKVDEVQYNDTNKLATIPDTKRLSSRFVANVGTFNIGLLHGQDRAIFGDTNLIHPNPALYENWEYSYNSGLLGNGLSGTLLITLSNGSPDPNRTMKLSITSNGNTRVAYLGNHSLCILTTIKNGYSITVEMLNGEKFKFGEKIFITRFP